MRNSRQYRCDSIVCVRSDIAREIPDVRLKTCNNGNVRKNDVDNKAEKCFVVYGTNPSVLRGSYNALLCRCNILNL
jgi:hypothetical protein